MANEKDVGNDYRNCDLKAPDFNRGECQLDFYGGGCP